MGKRFHWKAKPDGYTQKHDTRTSMNTDHDKDQIEAQFTKLEEAIAASNPGILDVLQVYGGYEEALQQAEAYLAAFEAQPLCCQQPRDSEAVGRGWGYGRSGLSPVRHFGHPDSPRIGAEEVTMGTQESVHKDRIAFVGLLPTLLREHEGEVALMEGGELVGIFASDEAAFAEGVERFGIKRPFTMRPIVPETTATGSLSLLAGVSW